MNKVKMYGGDPELGASQDGFFNTDSFSEKTVRLGKRHESVLVILQ